MDLDHEVAVSPDLHQATQGGSAENDVPVAGIAIEAGGHPAEVEVPTRPASPAATEIVDQENEAPVTFESTPYPGVIARDYAYQRGPFQPAIYIFPIVASYIWFQFCRMQKRQTRMYINSLHSAFSGCELAHLMFFNWIQMKDISWKDARDSFGRALITIYEKGQQVQIDYGAKRPSLKSPLVRKWWSRFLKCGAINITRLTDSPQFLRDFEKREYEFYGPFGKAIHFYFTEEEKPTLWKLYNYLLGKGPKPDLTEKMEAVFRPVLHCWDGSAGGRGKPCERPRSKDDSTPRAGTEPEHVELDPELISVEFAKVLPFAMVRKELAKKEARELKARRRAQEKEAEKEAAEGVENGKKRKRRGNKWTHKKSRKAAVALDDEMPNSVERVRVIVLDDEPDKRVTRSMVRAHGVARRPSEPEVAPRTKVSAKKMKREKLVEELLKESGYLPKDKGKANGGTTNPPASPDDEGTAQMPALLSRKDKGKDVDVDRCQMSPIDSRKRKRDIDDDEREFLEYEAIEPALHEPGPSSRPMRYVRRRFHIPTRGVRPSTSPLSGSRGVPGEIEGTRNSKRKRDDEEESENASDASKRTRLEEPELSPEERMRRFKAEIDAILSRPPERPAQSDVAEMEKEVEKMLEEASRDAEERSWSSEENDAVEGDGDQWELDLFAVDDGEKGEDSREALESGSSSEEGDTPGDRGEEEPATEDQTLPEPPQAQPLIPEAPGPQPPSPQAPPPQPVQAAAPAAAANPPPNQPGPHLPQAPQHTPLRRHETTLFMGRLWSPRGFRPL